MTPWFCIPLVLCACGAAPGPVGNETTDGFQTSSASTTLAQSSGVSTAADNSLMSGTTGGGASSTGEGEPLRPCDEFGDALTILADALQTSMSASQIPGASVAIRFPGSEICTLEAGWADVPSQTPITADSLWRIGSVTKNVVAGLVMRAVDEDLVALDDPITDYVLAAESRLADISVRDLLRHTSGIPNFTDPSSPEFWPQWQTDPDQRWDPLDLVGYAWGIADGSCFEPGTGWSYSNTNYIILGMLLEEVYAAPIDALVEAQVDALELGSFFISSEPDVPQGLVRGYLLDPDREFCALLPPGNPYVDEQQLCDATESLHTSAAGAAGAITATPAGMVAWLDGFLTGVVFDEALLAEVEDFRPTHPQVGPCPAGGPSLRYGLGLFEMTTTSGIKLIGHNGNINGYQAVAMHSEANDFTIALTINRGDLDAFAVLDDLLAALAGG